MLGSRKLGQRTQGVDGTVCRSGRKTGACVPTRSWTASSDCSTSGWVSTTRQSSSIIDESLFPADGHSRIVRLPIYHLWTVYQCTCRVAPTFSGVYQIFFFCNADALWVAYRVMARARLSATWKHGVQGLGPTLWLSVSGSCADDRVLLFPQTISVAGSSSIKMTWNDTLYYYLTKALAFHLKKKVSSQTWCRAEEEYDFSDINPTSSFHSHRTRSTLQTMSNW